jgi:hypothetical protein
MRILLKLELDCDPDAAWEAIRSPSVFRAASAPLTVFRSLEPEGFPERWPIGTHTVEVRALGLVPIGTQAITISEHHDRPGVRIVRDSGGGLSGSLTVVTHWRHSMAVSATPDGRTLFRDQLEFSAGALTVLMWPVYWLFWQWRAYRMIRFAPSWS